ncbi:MAG: ankyrin repeat domain-containing protein, partial [Myxococcales bacterium]|nr:ankyrin repeat domain-containing protein [Myxococcales bacterium]
WTALMGAANAGKARIVALLLARGADREIVDDDGRTALSLAREEGHTAVVKLLELPPKPGVHRRLFGGK